MAGFTDEDVEKIDNDISSAKKKNEESKVEEDPIIIKKIDVELPVESEKQIEVLEQESEEEQILNSVITRLNEI